MEQWPTIGMGNLQAMMVMRQHNTPIQSINGFDPYQTMLKRKHSNLESESGYIDHSVEQYDPKDIKALEEFCQQHGILGFNFGKMNPKSALKMLKNKIGFVEETKVKKILLD